MVVVLLSAGAHEPLIPLVEVVGNGLSTAPEQIAATGLNAGVTGHTSHETVLEVVAKFPQASIAVNVLVCEKVQPVVTTVASLCVTVGIPHASVAVAVPSAALISEAVALQLSVVVAVSVMTGAVTSTVLVMVCVHTAVLPQGSVAR